MARPDAQGSETNNLFREANERIRARSSEHSDPLDRIPFLCECSEERCTTIVRLTPAEYGLIRAHPDRYFTAIGHEVREGPLGEVVSTETGYVIIRRAREGR
jgi:hypothetical protein